MTMVFCEGFSWWSTAILLDGSTPWNPNRYDEALDFISIGNQAETNGVCPTDASGRLRASTLGNPVDMYAHAFAVRIFDSVSTLIFGCRLRPNVFHEGYAFLTFDNGSSFVLLRSETGNRIGLYINGVLIDTSVAGLTLGAEVVLEVKIVVGASGTVEVRVEGEEILSVVANTTGSGGGFTSCVLGFYAFDLATDQPCCIDYRDIYVLDGDGVAPANDFLGPTYAVEVKHSALNGAVTQWRAVPGTNTNAQSVVSNDGDTSYVAAVPTEVKEDRYTKSALSGTPEAIVGVRVAALVKPINTCLTVLTPQVVIAGTPYDNGSASFSGIDTEYNISEVIFSVSPATTDPWTLAEVNAAEFGMKAE